MIYLLLSILSSTIITFIFRISEKHNVKLLNVIVINYITATILGLSLSNIQLDFLQILSSAWFNLSVLIGLFFIIGFYLIGYSTQKAGMGVTTISNKMSVVIPMLFSIIFYSESVYALKIIGIILAVVSVFLSAYKKSNSEFNKKLIFLPVSLFIVIGFIDTIIKIAQADFLTESEVPIFTAVSFGIAGIIGIVITSFKPVNFVGFANIKTIISGSLIGTANFGSIFFLISALNKSGFESSIVFGINNIAIIVLSVTLGIIFFKEQVNRDNKIGFTLSLVSLFILMEMYNF